MNKSGSLCPALKAADVVGDKWTLLILRELIFGTTRYSDFERAIPRISPSVLSGRLKQMEAAGLIVKRTKAGRGTEYHLTKPGKELAPILDDLARWGFRWAKRRIEEEDIDVSTFMWDFHRNLKLDELPEGETVFCVQIEGQEKLAKWWVIAREGAVELCNDDPGFDVDLYIAADLPTLAGIWVGDCDLREVVRSGMLKLTGEPDLERSYLRWFPQSTYLDEEPVAAAE